MRNIIPFALIVLLASCNNSNSSNNADKTTDSAKTTSTAASSSKKFTSACDALTLADVKKIFGLQIDDNYVPSTENYANILRCEYAEQSKYVADPFKQRKVTIDIQGGEDLNRWLKTARNAGKIKRISIFYSSLQQATALFIPIMKRTWSFIPYQPNLLLASITR